MVEIDECVRWPEFLPKLFPRDNLSMALQEEDQDLKRLVLQSQPHASLAQFAAAGVGLEHAEAKYSLFDTAHCPTS
jgi:hypothetical protein